VAEGEALGQPQRFGKRLPAAGDGADKACIGKLLRRPPARRATPSDCTRLARQCLHQAPRRAAVGRQARCARTRGRIASLRLRRSGRRPSASEKPAPAAAPSTAAITGFGNVPQCFDELMQVFEHLDCAGGPARRRSSSPCRLPPAQKCPPAAAQDGGPQSGSDSAMLSRFDPAAIT